MTKPKPNQHITYGKTGQGKAPHDPSKVRNYRVDTSDIEPAPFVPLSIARHPHLDSRLWRRDGRTLVALTSDTPADNLDTRHLRKLPGVVS